MGRVGVESDAVDDLFAIDGAEGPEDDVDVRETEATRCDWGGGRKRNAADERGPRGKPAASGPEIGNSKGNSE